MIISQQPAAPVIQGFLFLQRNQMELMARLPEYLDQALARRVDFFQAMTKENTNCFRLFHGVVEGIPGLTIDLYGPVILVQTFAEPLNSMEIQRIEAYLRNGLAQFGILPNPCFFVVNHRNKPAGMNWDDWHQPEPAALAEQVILEMGARYVFKARHRGLDPLLFLDFRTGRRFIQQHAQGKTVLNLFAYTCGIGIAAMLGNAHGVLNIDFAGSALAYGQQNQKLNKIGDEFRIVQEDVFCALHQLADQPLKGKRARRTPQTQLSPQQFDWVVLDPPPWAKSPYGAVDVVRDYQSLFKPCLWVTKPQGQIMAVNNSAQVTMQAWLQILERCAAKAGSPLKKITTISPDPDFPSWDQHHPLKIAICEKA